LTDNEFLLHYGVASRIRGFVRVCSVDAVSYSKCNQSCKDSASDTTKSHESDSSIFGVCGRTELRPAKQKRCPTVIRPLCSLLFNALSNVRVVSRTSPFSTTDMHCRAFLPAMRANIIDRSATVFGYDIEQTSKILAPRSYLHPLAHLGYNRTLFLGPQVLQRQHVLTQFLGHSRFIWTASAYHIPQTSSRLRED